MLVKVPVPYRPHRGRIRQTSTPPAPQVHVAAVLAGDFTADWLFDSDIVSLDNIAPLMINGESPTSIAEIVGNTARLNYDINIAVGDPWTYDGTPVGTFANGGALQAGSGETVEG